MVSSPMIPRYGYHVRSTSFPSSSHPLTANVEEELYKLRSWVALKSSGFNNAEELKEAFYGLLRLFESVEDLLLLSSIQQVIVRHCGERCVDKLLDGILGLLDVTGTTNDLLVQIKEHVHKTQSALRRRKSEFDINAYTYSSKKINKVIQKRLSKLRKLEMKHPISPLEEDQDFVAVLTVLREVQVISLHVFESLLYFMSGSRKTCTKQHGWSLVSKLIMHDRRVTCEEQHEVGNEVDDAHTAVLALNSHKCPEVGIVQKAQKRLQILDASIEDLEKRLECLFKKIITTRVALLNILST